MLLETKDINTNSLRNVDENTLYQTYLYQMGRELGMIEARGMRVEGASIMDFFERTERCHDVVRMIEAEVERRHNAN